MCVCVCVCVCVVCVCVCVCLMIHASLFTSSHLSLFISINSYRSISSSLSVCLFLSCISRKGYEAKEPIVSDYSHTTVRGEMNRCLYQRKMKHGLTNPLNLIRWVYFLVMLHTSNIRWHYGVSCQSLDTRSYCPSVFIAPLDNIQCMYKGDECEFLSIG